MEYCDLHIPRILCLHGGGTNARIFRAQCRVFSDKLKGTFRLVFAEGPFPSEPGPDVMSAYKDWGPFRAWVPRNLTEELLTPTIEAIDHTMGEDNKTGAQGPWVGVLGFSQGAKVAASLLLLHQQIQQVMGEYSQFAFKFGVLIAGRGPMLQLHPSVKVDVRLQIPTIHVHGLQDVNIDHHRRLLDNCCEPGTTRLLEWHGKHRVPVKSKDVGQIVALVQAVAEETGVSFSMMRL